MKKYTFLLFILIVISGCTFMKDAMLYVECPCIVTHVDKINESTYRIYVNSTIQGDDDFSFLSKLGNEYKVGDIIK